MNLTLQIWKGLVLIVWDASQVYAMCMQNECIVYTYFIQGVDKAPSYRPLF